MRVAIAYTIAALRAAAEVDADLTDDDRAALNGEAERLQPQFEAVTDAHRALEEYDVTEGTRLQARVIIGDGALDRSVRRANAATKLGLDRQPGLSAAHVFGAHIDDLVKAPIKLEPQLVHHAVDRMSDVAGFPGKEEICADLTARATLQQQLLAERDGGTAKRSKLQSAVTKSVTDASHELARTKGMLDQRFPRQRDYVAGFFTPGPRSSGKRPAATPHPAPNGEAPQP